MKVRVEWEGRGAGLFDLLNPSLRDPHKSTPKPVLAFMEYFSSAKRGRIYSKRGRIYLI